MSDCIDMRPSALLVTCMVILGVRTKPIVSTTRVARSTRTSAAESGISGAAGRAPPEPLAPGRGPPKRNCGIER